jgi:uncharacterized protein YutE (UPF0331/DUF86 family)
VIDPELVTRKLVLIAEDLPAIEKLARQGLEEYQASPTSEVLAERYLERAIGRMIDVNYHLLTESGEPPPRDYFQSFVALGRLGVLDPGVARRIAACAGLRNRLVHEYDELDPEKVHQALQTAVVDLPLYVEAVRRFLDAGLGAGSPGAS